MFLAFFFVANPLFAQSTDYDGDGHAWPGDCNDSDSLTHPGAAEICDGRDNDCDGLVDNASSCVRTCNLVNIAGPVRTVPDHPGHSHLASLVWTGTEYGMAWADDRDGNEEIYFARLDSAGNKVSSDIRITSDPAQSTEPRLVWTGSEYGLAWVDFRDSGQNGRIYFTRLDASGRKLAPEIQISTESNHGASPDILWAGSLYGVVWKGESSEEAGSEVYFALLTRLGQQTGREVRLTHAGGNAQSPSIAWTGTEFGVAWAETGVSSAGIYFAHLDPADMRLGNAIAVTSRGEPGLEPHVVWNGSEYGLTWSGDGVHFIRITSDGSLIGADTLLSRVAESSSSPRLSWTGFEYGLTWAQGQEGSAWISFTRLDPLGTKIGPDLRLAVQSESSELPMISWSGSEYAIAWSSFIGVSRDVVFDRIDCFHTPPFEQQVNTTTSSQETPSSRPDDSAFVGALIPVGDYPVIEAVEDLDGDGNLDLIVSVSHGPTNQILFGDGRGNFPRRRDLPCSGSVAVADFNRDGRQDLVCNNSLYFGDASGFFLGPFPLPVAGNPLAGDFNSDGLLDIAVSSGFVLLGHGDGTFGAPIAFGHIGFLKKGDFNGDGLLDLVAWPGRKTLGHSWFLVGNGDGTFTPTPLSELPYFMESLDVGDLNNDGITDIVSTGDSDIVLLGSPDGTFHGIAHGICSHLSFGYCPDDHDLSVNDFDGDGVLDLAIGSYNQGIWVILGQGDGTFGEVLPLPGSRVLSLGSGDFNNDGKMDLALGVWIEGDISILLGAGDGTFGSYALKEEKGLPMAGADLDGDGFDDWIFLEPGDGHVRIQKSRGDGTFERIDTALLSSVGIGIGDINSDHVPDLVSLYHDDLGVLRGLGRGVFAPPEYFSAVASTGGPVLGDFNSDGQIDVLIAVTDGFCTLLNSGRGDLLPPSCTDAGVSGSKIATGDFDSNQALDLAFLSGSCTYFMSGDGAGGFEAPGPIALIGDQEYCRSGVTLVAGDFNRDSISDLVVGGAWQVLLGEGGKGPVPTTVLQGQLPYPFTSATGDFDGDGILDLFSNGALGAGADVPVVAIFPGDGVGSFGPVCRFLSDSRDSATTGDLNGDSLPDFLIPAGMLGYRLLLNQGTATNHRPKAVVAASLDLECDGPMGAHALLDGTQSEDADSSSGSHDDISLFAWYENLGQPTMKFLGTGETLPVLLSFGAHHLTLLVQDCLGKTALADSLVTVEDRTPPALSVGVTPSVLWPPNHRMVQVRASVMASDLCGEASVSLLSIASDEEDDAAGPDDGDTIHDIQGADYGSLDLEFSLRAERKGQGEGRAYEVTYVAVDESGNQASATAIVRVPHDLGGATEPVLLSANQGPSGTALRWNGIPGALLYKVIRGNVGSLRETGEFIDLGRVSCIQPPSPATSTEGHEDAASPPAGEAYFYLVAYNDGQDSGFGSDTATKPRVKSGGGCQ